MQSIFVSRTSEFIDNNMLKEHSLRNSGFNSMLNTNKGFEDFMIENEGPAADLLFTYTVTAKYYLHGFFELNHLLNNFENDHTYGNYTFSLYNRLFYKVIGKETDISKYAYIMPRNGIFTSFLGPVLVDFGWASPIFLALFGAYTKRIHNRLISNDDSCVLLYVYLSVVILFFPIFNFIAGAKGLYIFTCFLLIKPLGKLKS